MATTMLLRWLCPLLVFAVVVVAPAGAATSPTALYSAILIAGEQSRSVHYRSVQSSGGDRIVELADASSDQGIQRISVTHNGQTGHVTVLVTPAGAYVSGDTFALTNYMGYAADAAAAYSEKWIEIPSSDGNYAPVASDVTMPQAVQLSVPTPVWLSSSVQHGQALIGVSGVKAATASSPAMTVSLYARASGSPLPVELDVVKGTYTATITYSHWNERVKITTPANATPIASTGLASGSVGSGSGCGCSS